MNMALRIIFWPKSGRNNLKIRTEVLRNDLHNWYDFFPMAQQPLVGQGLLIIEAS